MAMKIRGSDGLMFPATASGKTYGLTVLNDAKYGYSVQDNDLRVSIVRGAVYAQHQPRKIEPEWRVYLAGPGHPNLPHGAGASRRRLAGRRHRSHGGGNDRARAGSLPGNPSGHPRACRLPSCLWMCPTWSCPTSSRRKTATDLIIRCYETAGRATKASLDLGLVHRHWTGEFHPLEIKTLRVPLAATGKIREVNALEQ